MSGGGGLGGLLGLGGFVGLVDFLGLAILAGVLAARRATRAAFARVGASVGGADLDQLELLVRARFPVPLAQARAVVGFRLGDVQHLAAVPRDQPDGVAARVRHDPLLIRTAVAAILPHHGPIVGARLDDIQAIVALGVDDRGVPAG